MQLNTRATEALTMTRGNQYRLELDRRNPAVRMTPVKVVHTARRRQPSQRFAGTLRRDILIRHPPPKVVVAAVVAEAGAAAAAAARCGAGTRDTPATRRAPTSPTSRRRRVPPTPTDTHRPLETIHANTRI